jgi:8-oxo-dGTP pyrophosphatase MutT (NUDIX family)
MANDWPSSSESERAAGILLFRRSGQGSEFLLLRNSLHRTWGFPKGRAETGEGPLDTARREVLEETGIAEFVRVTGFREVIEYPVRLDDGGKRQKSVVYFLAETTAEATRSTEHDAMCWCGVDEARDRILHPNLRAVLDKAIRRIEPRPRGPNPDSM